MNIMPKDMAKDTKNIHKLKDWNNACKLIKVFDIQNNPLNEINSWLQNRYPSAPCSFVEKKYYSQCLQKHNFVRLLAYTYEEGLHIDSFKMPIACSCHISEPRTYA